MSEHPHLVPPRTKPFSMKGHTPDQTGDMTREQALEAIVALRLRLNELQDKLYADKRFGLLVVLQGIDAAGKDGTIKSVFQEIGPLGCDVVNFGVPTPEEAAHDFLWRYHLHAPERGKIMIFNRSYYESVLVERVDNLVPAETWKRRYDQINAFEKLLVDEGTIIAKFFLHISREEQRERLQERIDNPAKRWKFRSGDLAERQHWDAYTTAFEDMITHCNSEAAPWYAVPANHKWYRDVVVAQALIDRLESLKLRYPQPEAGIEGLIVD
ncbi:MAG TPA: PPK2 family polyphosphate kinase [Tepidiformaceae bacterium]